jgi:hypothetical protein
LGCYRSNVRESSNLNVFAGHKHILSVNFAISLYFMYFCPYFIFDTVIYFAGETINVFQLDLCPTHHYHSIQFKFILSFFTCIYAMHSHIVHAKALIFRAEISTGCLYTLYELNLNNCNNYQNFVLVYPVMIIRADPRNNGH